MISVWLDAANVGLVLLGLTFFLAGTVGVLRLQDSLSRLHAVTKADNLGLGFIVLGLALLASSSSCYLIAQNEFAGKDLG